MIVFYLYFSVGGSSHSLSQFAESEEVPAAKMLAVEFVEPFFKQHVSELLLGQAVCGGDVIQTCPASYLIQAVVFFISFIPDGVQRFGPHEEDIGISYHREVEVVILYLIAVDRVIEFPGARRSLWYPVVLGEEEGFLSLVIVLVGIVQVLRRTESAPSAEIGRAAYIARSPI